MYFYTLPHTHVHALQSERTRALAADLFLSVRMRGVAGCWPEAKVTGLQEESGKRVPTQQSPVPCRAAPCRAVLFRACTQACHALISQNLFSRHQIFVASWPDCGGPFFWVYTQKLFSIQTNTRLPVEVTCSVFPGQKLWDPLWGTDLLSFDSSQKYSKLTGTSITEPDLLLERLESIQGKKKDGVLCLIEPDGLHPQPFMEMHLEWVVKCEIFLLCSNFWNNAVSLHSERLP